MNISKKLTLINQIIDGLKMDVIKATSKMPEEWDGVELRWYIEEAFRLYYGMKTDKRSKRYQDYRNFIITKGGDL